MARCPTCRFESANIQRVVDHAIFCQSRIDRAKRIRRERAAAKRVKLKEEKV